MGKFSDLLERVLPGDTPGPPENERLKSPRDALFKRPEPILPRPRALEPEQVLKTGFGFKHRPPNKLFLAGRQDGNIEASFAAEQFKVLCSQVLFPLERKPARKVMVTSAIPGEGKTMVAVNLAASIALGGRQHVFLIECDLRKPSVAKFFGLDDSRGLVDLLTQRDELQNLLVTPSVENLTLLPAGRRTPQAFELLSSPRMKGLLEQVENRYEGSYIILDSSPTHIAPETSVLGQLMEGVVLVARYGMSSRKVIQEAVGKIGKDKFLGVVFNDFRGVYTNKYYYHYYGKEQKA